MPRASPALLGHLRDGGIGDGADRGVAGEAQPADQHRSHVKLTDFELKCGALSSHRHRCKDHVEIFTQGGELGTIVRLR